VPRQPATSETDGWIQFASIALVIVGVFNVFDGIVALAQRNFFAVAERDLVFGTYAAWGWGHIVIGAVLVVAGLAIAKGHTWGRAVALVFLVLNIFAHIAFVPAAPVWSMLIMVFDVFLIYAITIHLEESRALLA